jgi:hypothetical protein
MMCASSLLLVQTLSRSVSLISDTTSMIKEDAHIFPEEVAAGCKMPNWQTSSISDVASKG